MNSLRGPFPGGPFAGRPFSRRAGGGGGASGTDIDGWFVARLSANQDANNNINQHVEYDVSNGSGIATLSTGAGQANGLVTINETGDYYVSMSMRALVNESSFLHGLRFHPSDTDVVDKAGAPLWIVGYDNVSINSTECTRIASIVSFTAGDIIKQDVLSSTTIVRYYFEFASLVLLKVG